VKILYFKFQEKEMTEDATPLTYYNIGHKRTLSKLEILRE